MIIKHKHLRIDCFKSRYAFDVVRGFDFGLRFNLMNYRLVMWMYAGKLGFNLSLWAIRNENENENENFKGG